MRDRRTHEIALRVALRMWRADAAGQAHAIFEAARARHGHAVAMGAWDQFEWMRRTDNGDQAQALRELADAMGDA
jgi:hypothetical protein